MDPRAYRQWSPPVRKGGRAVSGLGLFVNADPESAKKAVPIIGEDKKDAPTPKLVTPGAAPKPSAKILTPGAPQQPSGKLITPGAKPKAETGLVGAKGQPISAPKPEVFQGKTVRPKPEAPPKQPGAGLVAPGPQSKPDAKLVIPGATTPKTSGSLARTPHDKPMQPDKPLVDPHGREVSSKLTAGPGAAKPSPKLAIPIESMPKRPRSGKIETSFPSSARSGSKTTAEDVQWSAAIESAKKREATAAGHEARSRPLDFKPKPQAPAEAPKSKDVQATETAQALTAATTPEERKLMAAGGMKDPKSTPESGPLTSQQKKMMAASSGGGGAGGGKTGAGGATTTTASSETKGDGKKTSTGGPQISGPGLMSGVTTGMMYSNLNAPLSAATMDAAGALQGLTSTGTRHERDRDARTGIAQRHEVVRQGDAQARAQARATQSAMKNASMAPREDSARVRSGLRSYVND